MPALSYDRDSHTYIYIICSILNIHISFLKLRDEIIVTYIYIYISADLLGSPKGGGCVWGGFERSIPVDYHVCKPWYVGFYEGTPEEEILRVLDICDTCVFSEKQLCGFSCLCVASVLREGMLLVWVLDRPWYFMYHLTEGLPSAAYGRSGRGRTSEPWAHWAKHEAPNLLPASAEDVAKPSCGAGSACIVWALRCIRLRLSGCGGCFSFGGTVQYIEESNIYLCFVVCRLKRGLVTWPNLRV